MMRRFFIAASTVSAGASMASDAEIEPCLEPAMFVHIRAEGFPLSDVITVCRNALDASIFVERAPTGFQSGLPVEVRREGSGAVVRFKPEGGKVVSAELEANLPERRIEGFSAGGALLVRLEAAPLPEDPLARLVTLGVTRIPVTDLVSRFARIIDHRIEGAEMLCDEKITLHFSAIPMRAVLQTAADVCGLRIDRSGDGVIRIDTDRDQPWAEAPPSPVARLFADLNAALAKAKSPAEASGLLAQADTKLAAMDPDRIGPVWIELALLRARHGPESERLTQLDAAIDMHARLLPTDADGGLEHDRRTAALLAQRAETLVNVGRRADALADYERAIALDAFEPDLMSRAEALIAPGERAAWWRRQWDAADRLLDEVAEGTDEHLSGRYDHERHSIVMARAAHPIAVDALLAGRYRDASKAWSHILFWRAEHLGKGHRRVRDAQLEYALLVEVSHTLARSPAEIPLPEPPLSVDRESLGEGASLLDRLFDRDLLDADLAAAVEARLAAASSPNERARLAVLAAEVALTREGAAALTTAIGHYRTVLAAHAEDDFDRHLLVRRLGLLESWHAARE